MRAAAVTAVTVAIVAAGVPTASADLTVPTISPTPLPTVSVPLPSPSLPSPSLPQPTLSAPVGDVSTAVGGEGGAGGSGGATSGQGPNASADQSSGPAPVSGATSTAPRAGSEGTGTTRDRAVDRKARAATPMVAGTPAARDLLDDEDSPQLLAASRDFLAADEGIAEIARQKRILSQLQQQATETAALYRAFGYDVLTAQAAADRMHARYDELRRQLAAEVRDSYRGDPSARMSASLELADLLARLSDGSTRADLRVGDLTVRRMAVRAEYERIVDRYDEAKRRLRDANERLAVLAAQRSTALEAVRAAQASDIALHQARVAESGELGAQIRAASARIEQSGRTIEGTGSFTAPLGGHVTSPFGMRRHPILGYVKLHTGTDFAGGDTIVAADRGRVLMTVTSTAYGLFTVIDHGVIDGKRVTTAYAHQASFLVVPGQEVRKGQPIGVVGSTGYSTGPHLHFEVREDGAVVDPMTWLTR